MSGERSGTGKVKIFPEDFGPKSKTIFQVTVLLRHFLPKKKDKNYTWTDDILKDENPGFFKSFFSKKKA